MTSLKRILCTATTLDEEYLKHTLVLYLSFRTYHPETIFHLHLIKTVKESSSPPSSRPIIIAMDSYQVQNLSSNSVISQDTLAMFQKLANNDPHLTVSYSILPTLDRQIIRGYATNIKAALIPWLLETTPANIILWCGATSIIRASLDSLFNQIKKHRQVAYWSHQGRRQDAKGWKGGILGFRRSKINQMFLQKWQEDTFRDTILGCRWFQDQHNINHNSLFTPFNISYSYIDWDHQADSVIWVGKGKTRHNSRFRALQQRYLNTTR